MVLQGSGVLFPSVELRCTHCILEHRKSQELTRTLKSCEDQKEVSEELLLSSS